MVSSDWCENAGELVIGVTYSGSIKEAPGLPPVRATVDARVEVDLQPESSQGLLNSDWRDPKSEILMIQQ